MTLPKSETWGLGPAPLVKRATKDATEVIAVVSDIHFPHHDPKVLSSALNLIKALEPHRLVCNGDLNDFFGISSHNKGLERLDSLQDELDGGNAIRARLRQAAPNALFDETTGNHEERITTYVAKNARALTSLRNLNPASLFEWEANEITSHGTHGFRLRPHFLVKHGTLIRAGSGNTAKAEHLASGVSGVSGHTHRLGKYRKDGYIPRQWNEGGCLASLSPDYVENPDWEHGMLIISLSTRSDNFKTEMISTFNGRFTYGGKSF